ncbi:autoinducer binding domain-containing protein [Amorphus sp. 3PC139-8]|uniref:autoinducer binding domain-containing protein n=1 Tax=Amorphus sp. 3PC139-8 TaxID=2735676 RepID=UPI00345DDBB3
MELLTQALGTLDRLRRATSLRDVTKCVDQVVLTVGLSGFGFYKSGLRDRPGSRVLLLDGWDKAWSRTYQDGNYLDHDPIVGFAEACIDPYRWSTVRKAGALSDAEQEVLDSAADHGLVDGVGVPVRSVAFSPGVAVFGGSTADLGPDEMAFLQLVAANAHVRLTGAVVHSVPDSSERGVLTRRERECLQWCAEGKTSWEISQILSISQHTADWYLASASRKLAASNRLHAVAEALRRGLIS